MLLTSRFKLVCSAKKVEIAMLIRTIGSRSGMWLERRYKQNAIIYNKCIAKYVEIKSLSKVGEGGSRVVFAWPF